jgi:hypothetical protein
MITKLLLATPKAVVGALLVAFAVAQADTAEMQFDAQLVWGTNDEKPDDPKLKEVDDRLKERLTAVFKWTHYFVVHQESIEVSATGSDRIKLSEKSEIEIENVGRSKIVVKLFGEGKLVRRVTQRVAPSELLVIAGEDKNDTAWFIVLTRKK